MKLHLHSLLAILKSTNVALYNFYEFTIIHYLAGFFFLGFHLTCLFPTSSIFLQFAVYRPWATHTEVLQNKKKVQKLPGPDSLVHDVISPSLSDSWLSAAAWPQKASLTWVIHHGGGRGRKAMITALQTRSPTHTDSPESSAAAAPSQGDDGGQRERAEENHAGDEVEKRTAEPVTVNTGLETVELLLRKPPVRPNLF